MVASAPRCPARLIFTISSNKRSEEHTSELQSRLHLVCRLLLEKKKKNHYVVCCVDGAMILAEIVAASVDTHVLPALPADRVEGDARQRIPSGNSQLSFPVACS